MVIYSEIFNHVLSVICVLADRLVVFFTPSITGLFNANPLYT